MSTTSLLFGRLAEEAPSQHTGSSDLAGDLKCALDRANPLICGQP